MAAGRPSTARSITWMTSGGIKFEVGFLIDALTDDDAGRHLRVADGAHLHHRLHAGRSRLTALLQLHLAVHLLDADAGDEQQLLQLFFGWEAVGLVSYLLIGFWFTRPTAIFANMKAFLVNRVGDFGFILGIGLSLIRRHASTPGVPKRRTGRR